MITAIPTKARAEDSLLTIERIADDGAFSALREEWNELLQSSDADGLFLTWEWLYTWWKHLADGRELSILAARRGGRLVGLAPFVLRPASLLGLRPLRVREFLGNGCAGSDYLDFIVARGCEAEARAVFVSSLAKESAVLDCAQLRRESCFAAGVAADLRGAKWSGSDRMTNTCPYISLGGKSWEGYLATLGAEHRYNFNRKWRRLNREFSVQFERVEGEEQCRESIELMMKLHNLRRSELGGSDAFHTAGLVALHREFSFLALRRGWLRLYILRLDGRPAACLYAFRYGKTFYFYQSGFDPAYQKYSVGLVSMGLGIQSALEEGADEYDLLHGDEEYKSHWSHERRELGRLELFPPGGRGHFCRQAVELERSMRRMARRALTRLSR